MRWLPAAVIGLLLVPGIAAHAADPSPAPVQIPATPTLPVSASPATVVVDGHVRMRTGRAKLERAAGKRHWTAVGRLRIRHHRFSTTTTQRKAVARYRISSHGWHSRAFVVRRGLGAAATATGTAGPSCGAPVLKADGTPWTCTFDDEFDGTTLDRSKWLPETSSRASGSSLAHACYRDDPANVNVAGGSLNLVIRKEATAVACSNTSLGSTSKYTAGSVTTYHLFSQQYGRFEARVKNTAATASGLQESFWLWPDDRVASALAWPAAGEIDIAETFSKYYFLAVPYLHYTDDDNGGGVNGLNTAWGCAANRGEWNTYTLDWSASRLEIDVNGTPCLVNTSGDPAFQKPYIIALSALLGQDVNSLSSKAPLPDTMSIDYVRVWR